MKTLTIPAVIENSAKNYPNHTAVSFIDAQPIKYSEYKRKIDGITEFLKNEGIAKGDKVAILSENHVNWGIAFFGITSLGAIAVPIMQEFHANEVQHIIRHSESKAVFVSEKYLNKLEDAEFDDLQTVILIEDFSILPMKLADSKVTEFFKEGKKELAKIKEKTLKFVGLAHYEVLEDDVASLIYTSGTTGHSKGVMLAHKAIVFDAYATATKVGVEDTDKMLSILPLSHTIECTLGLVTPIMQGAAVYYLDKLPNASNLLPALQKVKPTIMLSVPLIIEKIFKSKIQPEFRKNLFVRSMYKILPIRKKINAIAGKKLYQTFGGRLKMFCIGGAPLAEDVEKFLREAKFPYSCGYGLTETSPLCTGEHPRSAKFRSVGKPLAGVEVKIDKPDPKTGEGEIWVRGANVMKGYFKHPDKTAEVLTDDGWFKTGDSGRIDSEGYLFILGRIKNLILGANGKNIYPEVIEGLINEFKYVVESIVLEKDKILTARIHLDHKELDEEFSSKKLTETEIAQEMVKILDHIKHEVNLRLPSYSKIMKVIEQTIPFEKTPTMKIKRHMYA